MLKRLFITAMAMATPAAFATDSTRLELTGRLAPGACNIEGELNFDFKAIPYDWLFEDKPRSTDEKVNPLIISCSALTRFALNVVDNIADTSYDPASGYGLGVTDSGKKLGYYVLLALSYAGGNTRTTISQDAGATWSPVSAGTISAFVNDPNVWIGYNGQIGSTSGPTPTLESRMAIGARAFIAPAKDLDPKEPMVLNGSATLELKYL
jgi:hypothetical protein